MVYTLVGIPPEFLGQVDDRQYGVEGRTSKIVFKVRAYPDPKITWYFNDRKIDMGDRYTSTLSGAGELTLEIHRFSWGDVGPYKVQVENLFGHVSKTVQVEMAGKYILICRPQQPDLAKTSVRIG